MLLVLLLLFYLNAKSILNKLGAYFWSFDRVKYLIKLIPKVFPRIIQFSLLLSVH